MQFIVLKEAPSSLLGAQTCQEMDLLQIHRHNIEIPVYSLASAISLSQERILSEFRDVFDDKTLGCLEGEVALQLEQSSRPVQMPLRRFPVAVQEDLRTELARLVKLGVLAKVEAPSAWVSSLVVERKRNGKIRLCVDPKFLNKALKRSHYPLPVIEDILPKLAKAKVFTVVDARSGFWQIKLTEDASKLTRMATPIGRYKWLRLPF